MRKYTKDILIQILIDFHKKHNRVPTAHETTKIEGFPRYGNFERYFGSWKKAVEAAGLTLHVKESTTRNLTCTQCAMHITVENNAYLKSNTKKFFCSNSCAATYNNTGKIKSEATKEKIRSTLKQKKIKPLSRFMKPKHPQWRDNICGPYCNIYKNTCVKTNKTFLWKSRKKYDPNIIGDKDEYYRQCQFNFSLNEFSNWFKDELPLISEFGWYAPTNSGKANLQGISRDHIFSITQGWKNNIPSWKIRHPANLRLLPHTKNQAKGSQSLISSEELDARIYEFEMAYPNYIRT